MRWLALLLVLIAIAGLGHLANVNAETKMIVLKTSKFTNETHYLLDSAAGKLLDYNTSYAVVLDYEIRDLNSSDSYYPVILLHLDAPSADLNTNETVLHAWLLAGAYGSAAIAVADINTTDGSVLNISYYKISPLSGDVAIIRTRYDVLIEGYGYKLSIPLAGYHDPKVLLYTDSSLVANSLSYVELRAIANPPNGYTLLRSGSGPAEFTITASGSLSVWFDESHDGGDLDLYIYDSNNPSFDEASTSQPWGWHLSHATAYIWADAFPDSRTIDAHGTVKFVVVGYAGNANTVNWSVAARLSSGDSPQPEPQPTFTAPENTTSSGLFARLQGAYESNPALFIAIVVLIAVAAAIILGRR